MNDMKKCLFVMLMLLPMTVSAYDVEIDGIYYNIYSGTASVTAGDEKYTGEIIIPSEISYEGTKCIVLSIEQSAFLLCTGLTSVSIPSSVISIENRAFSGCSKLNNVILEEGLERIGKYGFTNCMSLTNISIPNTVISLGESAFEGCISLTSVSLSSGLTRIDNGIFKGCEKLAAISIPTSVTYIGDSSFSGCKSLTSVNLPDEIGGIGSRAFNGCSGLSSIVIPNSVTMIGSYAFASCGLSNITLGNSIETIGDRAFFQSTLDNVYCYAEVVPFASSTSFNNISVTTLHVPSKVINDYKTTQPWSNFNDIVALEGGELIKCATPTIAYSNGRLIFTCDTEGAECVATITDADIKTHYGNEIPLTMTYTVSVYATKEGYKNSDVVTKVINIAGAGGSGMHGDVNGDGVVDAADVVKVTNIIMGKN